MDRLETFIRLFEIPPAIQPYVAVFADEVEIDLIIAMNGNPMGVEEVAQALGMTRGAASDLLERSYRRHVVHQEVDGKKVGYIFDYQETGGKPIRYIPARFYDRLDELSMYGDWDRIPEAVREEIADWWLKDYAEKIAPVVERIKKDPDAYQQIKQKDFLLLEQALEQVEKAEYHAVVNCDCRASTEGCSRMLESCIRLDDGARYTVERGLGREVSKEACKQIVLRTDREGLMHIGTLRTEGAGLFGFCNCCTCCCFPLRSSSLLDSDRVYPRVHYVAEKDDEGCTHCGICIKRCQYGAFSRDERRVVAVKGKERKAVVLDPSRCYGCGLCRTACPKDCIRMQPLG